MHKLLLTSTLTICVLFNSYHLVAAQEPATEHECLCGDKVKHLADALFSGLTFTSLSCLAGYYAYRAKIKRDPSLLLGTALNSFYAYEPGKQCIDSIFKAYKTPEKPCRSKADSKLISIPLCISTLHLIYQLIRNP